MGFYTQTPILTCTYICFRKKNMQCEVASQSSRIFSFILDFKKLPTIFKVCINILAETYLLICGRADLSWQIYAEWGSCVFFLFFFFFFLIITFNMQHAVISIHVRDMLHATEDVTKLLDNVQGLRRGWLSDMQSRTSF